MNKAGNYLAVLLLAALTALSLTGCTSDDVDEAYDLNGYWQGTIEGDYYSSRYHDSGRWDTEIWFVQDGDFSNGGYGREIDYSWNTGRPYTVDFDWEIVNGDIYIDYYDGYRIIIKRYELYYVGSGQRFRGEFWDYYTGDYLASFNLVKVGGWTDWAKRHAADYGSMETGKGLGTNGSTTGNDTTSIPAKRQKRYAPHSAR